MKWFSYFQQNETLGSILAYLIIFDCNQWNNLFLIDNILFEIISFIVVHTLIFPKYIYIQQSHEKQ